jgi:hypothetical protein
MGQEPRRPILKINPAVGKRGEKQDQPPPPPPKAEALMEEIAQPTEESIRTVLSRIEEAFFALGTDKLPGTIIPVGGRNNAKEAGEFVIADRLSKLATDRLKKAVEEADKSGVFGDPSEYRNGETVMVFADPNFVINVKLGKPGKNINREKVEAAATVFLGKKSSEFLEQCFSTRAAAKQIIVAMK